MRAATIASVMSFAVVASSQAALIASNLPTTNGSGFSYGLTSDAISSAGSYYYHQATAVTVTTASAYALTQLTFWGSSEAFNAPGLSNFSGFQMTIYNSAFTQVVAQKTWTMAQLQSITTGNTNASGGIEYQFAGTMSGISLAAGTYRVSVGALLVDGQGDAFVWSAGTGTAGGYNTGNTGTFGTNWTANTTAQGAGSYLLFGNVVPAPGAFALLAMAGVTSRRRRA